MKKSNLINIVIVILAITSFLIGRESVHINTNKINGATYLSDSLFINDNSKIIEGSNLLDESSLNKVFRCGNSMIYHPTTKHGSFKRCKSKITELNISKAKQLGMRHCKCSY